MAVLYAFVSCRRDKYITKKDMRDSIYPIVTKQAKYTSTTHTTMSARLFCRFKVSPFALATRSGHRLASTYPTAIKPTKHEISSGRLASRNLEKAIRCLHEDGLVVIEDAIPHEDLDRLNAKMVQDARTLQSRGKDMPFNYNVGNSKLHQLTSRRQVPNIPRH
jgi:hypothetical protein